MWGKDWGLNSYPQDRLDQMGNLWDKAKQKILIGKKEASVNYNKTDVEVGGL